MLRTALNHQVAGVSEVKEYSQSEAATEVKERKMRNACKCLKKWNLNEKQNLSTDVDRLSNLPDDIISIILSKLPTKDAVKTSILSTRWIYLWTSITNLDFDDSLLYSSGEQNFLGGASFSAFVNRVLSLRNAPNIERFQLALCMPVHASHLISWIDTAINEQVQELDVSLQLDGCFTFPHCLFFCESLIVLKLKLDSPLKAPADIRLPKLRILCLSHVIFLDVFSIQQLLSSCPILEELSFLDCDWKSIKRICIFAPTLKSLTIHHFRCSLLDQSRNPKIKICARNLKVLDFSSNLVVNFHLDSLYTLVHASIDIKVNRRVMQKLVGNHIIKLLGRICRLKSMTMSSDTLHSLACAGNLHKLPRFSNLTYFEVNMDSADCVDGSLVAVLQKSPKLQSVKFAEGIETDIDLVENHLILKPVPQCFTTCLKSFDVGCFNGTPLEIQLLQFVLENALVLERMRIHCSHPISDDLKRQDEVRNQLSMLPRSSGTCLIELS